MQAISTVHSDRRREFPPEAARAHGFIVWYSIWRTVSSAQVRQKLAKCARPLQLNSLVGDWYESKVCISCLKLNLCSTPDVPEKAVSALSWQLIVSGLIAADTKGGFRQREAFSESKVETPAYCNCMSGANKAPWNLRAGNGLGSALFQRGFNSAVASSPVRARPTTKFKAICPFAARGKNLWCYV